MVLKTTSGFPEWFWSQRGEKCLQKKKKHRLANTTTEVKSINHKFVSIIEYQQWLDIMKALGWPEEGLLPGVRFPAGDKDTENGRHIHDLQEADQVQHQQRQAVAAKTFLAPEIHHPPINNSTALAFWHQMWKVHMIITFYLRTIDQIYGI